MIACEEMAAKQVHKFERSHLGTAPFALIGYEKSVFVAAPGCPAQPGSTCDYCGTGIMHVYHIRSADGKRFKVGSECVNKTGDEGLVRVVKKKASLIALAARHESEDRRIAEVYDLVKSDAALRERMKTKPLGRTNALEYFEWMNDHAGRAGKLSVGRWVKRFAAGEIT